MDDAHRVVERYWAAAEARDWVAFGELIADDVLYEVPQTRERVRGREAYLRFNAEGFPGGWHLSVQRIAGEGRHAASWLEMDDDGDQYPGLCFFDLGEDGRIVRITDFWPQPYEPPTSRAHLVERY
jgi:SnoaL-like domain